MLLLELFSFILCLDSKFSIVELDSNIIRLELLQVECQLVVAASFILKKYRGVWLTGGWSLVVRPSTNCVCT